MRQHAGDVAGTGADVSDGRTAPGADRGPRVDARATTVAVGVPLLVAAAVLGTDLWLGDRLGDTVAIHWDGAGRPDGYGGRTGFVTAMTVAGTGVPIAVMLAACSARVWTALRRSLLGIGVWAAVVLGGLGVVCLVVQRDGAPGEIGGAAWWLMLAAVPLGVLAACVPRDLAPPVLATSRPPADRPRSTARAVEAHPIGLGARLAVTDDVLTVRWLGSTPVRIPVAEVEEARVARPTGWEWGGWGLRHQPGTNRYGFIGSGRAAVELHRADGTLWTVTTSRAEEVAGVVNAIADRQPGRGVRAARPGGADRDDDASR